MIMDLQYGEIYVKWGEKMKLENIDTKIMLKLIKNEEDCKKVMQYLKILDNQEKEERRILQKIGIEQAKSNNIKLGRPACKLPTNFYKVAALSKHGRISLDQALKELNMPRSTYYKKREEYKAEIDDYYMKMIQNN